MDQDLINRTCRSMSLPLHALIHDSIAQALNLSHVSRDISLQILESIPKMPLNPKELEELKSADGAIELEDSFGSGTYFVVDAGSQEAYVFTEKRNADYVAQLTNEPAKSGSPFRPDSSSRQEQNSDGQPQPAQGQEEAQARSGAKTRQNQSASQDLLAKLLLIESLKGNQEQNKRGVTKVGQKNKQQEQTNLAQQLSLLDLLHDNGLNGALKGLLKNLQTIYLLKQLGKSAEDPSGSHPESQERNQKRQPSPAQEKELLETLQGLQLINMLH